MKIRKALIATANVGWPNLPIVKLLSPGSLLAYVAFILIGITIVRTIYFKPSTPIQKKPNSTQKLHETANNCSKSDCKKTALILY